ncbi:hypothetical protein DUI87_34158 [Hirundo rustica rustica]|uniref:Uncharacterized protein n=1 Tax=Hirundo rustica rustica TaxID=333673 RepID=A0A3M0J4C5_HIRRU|nr:hypothetical protein DUI87_34158 [Hirundo rustica rustica]
MDQKSVQKEELPGGSSSSVAASAAEKKEMAGTNTVTDRENARAAKPLGEGDLDSQPTFKMEVLEDAEAKPVDEGGLDSQPTFRMEVLEDVEESLVLELFPEFQCSFYLYIQTPSGDWEQRYRLISSLSGVVLLSTRFHPVRVLNSGSLQEKGMPLPSGLLYSLYSWLSFANKQHRLIDLRLDLPEFLGTALTDSTSTPHVFQTMATLLKEIHDWKVQLTSTAEKEQDYLNQLLTLKTDLEQKANELESLKEKMAKTNEEIKSKLDEREENMKNLKKQVENKTKCIEELQQEVNKLQLEIENMNKQHKEAVDIYQKDIETRKVNENKLHEEVEKMKLLYDEATMIQRETDIRCQHKITEMVALMEKHKNEYDKMVEEKDAELKVYKIRQQNQLPSERALVVR